MCNTCLALYPSSVVLAIFTDMLEFCALVVLRSEHGAAGLHGIT